jgi:hypothetical protein
MTRNYESESDDEPDFFEEYDEAIKARVKSLKKPENALDAKALIALSEKLPKTKYRIYDNFQKKAKKIMEEMDEVMRVFVAEELREDYLAPQEDDVLKSMIRSCHFVNECYIPPKLEDDPEFEHALSKISIPSTKNFYER